MAELTDEQLRTYAKHPWRCPFCGSERIEGSPIGVEGDQAQWQNRCDDCQGEWWDIFERKYIAVMPHIYFLPKEPKE